MNLIPWRNKHRGGDKQELSSLAEFRREMDQWFDSFFSDPWSSTQSAFGAMNAWSPAVDIRETENEVTVKAEVPGIDPKDLDITVAGNVLMLSGEKREETEKKVKDVYHTERRFGSFRRMVQLPSDVDPQNVAAHYENGVVTIGLKKRPDAVPKRIPVKVC
jgi:HSP20 family protein